VSLSIYIGLSCSIHLLIMLRPMVRPSLAIKPSLSSLKKIEENPRRWHDDLSEALWAHRISRHGATKVTPFELVYGQKAILPIEVNLGAYRLAKQNDLDAVVYHNLMMDNIDEIIDKRMRALKEIEKDKARLARAYKNKVRSKSFQVDELVWKTILPLGTKDVRFRKWSPR
jgi:hypothetical protein